jgi:hypothetical protein
LAQIKGSDRSGEPVMRDFFAQCAKPTAQASKSGVIDTALILADSRAK